MKEIGFKMRTPTKFFGELDYEPGDRIRFPAGLPGFEELGHWLLLRPEGWEPLGFLQSLDRAETCFVVLPVEAIDARYELEVLDEDLGRLGIAPGSRAGLSSWAIVTLGEQMPATANLLAPVVIAPSTGLAVQAVRADQRYSAVQPVEGVAGLAACS